MTYLIKKGIVNDVDTQRCIQCIQSIFGSGGGGHTIFSCNTTPAQRNMGSLLKYIDFSEYLSLAKRILCHTWDILFI